MRIDWFTFAAQVINFLVLLYLLRRFLYGPILRAVQARQSEIAARLEEAERTRQRAQQEMEEHRSRSRLLEERRDELMEEARRAAGERKRQLMREVRDEIDEARERWAAAIEREKEDYLEDLRHRVGKRVFDVARRALQELADADLEERMVARFADRLEGLTPEDVVAGVVAGPAGRESYEAVVVRSSFELRPADRGSIEARVRRLWGARASDIEFQVDPEVICGVELRSSGIRVAWSLRDYLDSLEEVYFSGTRPMERERQGG